MADPFAFERRASALLYHYVRSVSRPGAWLLPANVCPIVPAVLIKAGREFEFLDIETDTLCIDRNAVIHRLSQNPEQYAGVLFVRTYGHPGDFEMFFRELKQRDAGVRLIDDRCLARPGFEHSGGVADLELYSTGYSKFVDIGWGGWGFSRGEVKYIRSDLSYNPAAHDMLVQRFRVALAHQSRFECPETPWLDARLPEIAWSDFRRLVESKMEKSAHHREHLNAIYNEELQQWALPADCHDWRFSILCDRPQELLEKISAAGHFASAHYASLVPMFGEGIAPVAQEYGRRVVNLFNDFRYDTARARALAQIIRLSLN